MKLRRRERKPKLGVTAGMGWSTAAVEAATAKRCCRLSKLCGVELYEVHRCGWVGETHIQACGCCGQICGRLLSSSLARRWISMFGDPMFLWCWIVLRRIIIQYRSRYTGIYKYKWHVGTSEWYFIPPRFRLSGRPLKSKVVQNPGGLVRLSRGL